MYYKRTLEKYILEASRQFPVILLTGPRQVGKTTLLKNIADSDREYISLDDLSIRELANNDPALFLQKYNGPVIIDEIQYAPVLLPYIKLSADNSTQKGKFWLTGSQQFHLMKGITESLAGRVAIINLFGFSAKEKNRSKIDSQPFLPGDKYFNRTFIDINTLFKDIWLGSYPALCTGSIRDRGTFYSSYIQTYIERDVRDLTQVGDTREFLRFVRTCAARTSQLLNISEIAKDTDISVTTAKKWLGILEAGAQIFILQPYHSNITKRLVKSPKVYFVDTGLCSYLTGWSSPETLLSGSMSGALFENYVLMEILKSWLYHLKSPDIFYFRDRDKKEIDFIIETDNMIFPIEAKLGATVKQDWIKNFSILNRLKKTIGFGAVISLTEKSVPLNEKTWAINAGMI